jgi:outer membrane phospholipase A
MLDLGIEHESNGKEGADSRSWNRGYLRFLDNLQLDTNAFWWSAKLAIPYNVEATTKNLPRQRGNLEFQIGARDFNFLRKIFDLNELVIRLYTGGHTRMNPFLGGQELTYRQKENGRSFLLPLYLQVFHGYGENLLDAEEERWGIRGGIGF